MNNELKEFANHNFHANSEAWYHNYVVGHEISYFDMQPGDGTTYKFSIAKVTTNISEVISGVDFNHIIITLHNLSNKSYPILKTLQDPYYIKEKFEVSLYTARALLILIEEALTMVEY